MKNSIIIAGLGRCGTTYIYNSLLKIFKSSEFFLDINSKRFNSNMLYKTHSYPPKKDIPKNIKIIFMFGNPYNIVESAHSNRMDIKQHYIHMNADFSKYKNYKIEDTLNLEKQFDSWCEYSQSDDKNDLMFLKYEDIPTSYDLICDFIGEQIVFSKWKKRKTYDVSDPDILKTYKSLKTKVDNTKTQIF